MNMMRSLLAIVLVLMMPISDAADKKLDWNDAALTWHDYDTGVAKMKRDKTKGLVLIYADWCPTCKQYSKLFKSKKVVAALDGLVLIRENIDHPGNAKWLAHYDKGYVPKTIALTSAAKVSSTVYKRKKKFMFYVDPKGGEAKLIKLINRIKRSPDR